jgi:hypothetical protein
MPEYTDTEIQSLIGYVRLFNKQVETVDGPGILRNFGYEHSTEVITSLYVELPNGEGGVKWVYYNFSQVKI